VLRLAENAAKRTGEKNLCLAGGVALNCVANGKLLRARVFENLWVQPAAGDAGGAIGAALYGWHQFAQKPRVVNGNDAMQGSYLGPAQTEEEIGAFLCKHNYPHEKLAANDWAPRIAELVADQKVVGLFQGRLEFGPRALGNRSIIADPRSAAMQSVLNRKIKFRESFRPFAPAVLAERASEVFELDCPSPYMLLVAGVKEELRTTPNGHSATSLSDRVKDVRSTIPAVTHVDYTARVQTVDRRVAPRFHSVIESFAKKTGVPVVINTSFNVRGEPLVCTAEDAYRCFMRTGMDHLVLESFLLSKTAQPPTGEEPESWKQEFPLD
jgi:carbamoyltransferase